MLAATIAALVALALAACTPASPQRTPTPTAASTPLFSSDAEALKAATDAYAAYLKMSDTISHDGGSDPERIKPYASGKALQLVERSAQQYRAAGAHSTGQSLFTRISLQRYDKNAVVFYACEDTSGIDLLNSEGHSISAADRQTLFPVEVTASASRESLVISDERNVDMPGICS